MTVGILIVSHSAAIATGTVELARQMAADVPLVAAGGTDDGGIGTSFEAITAGIEELADTEAVVVLCDLGSAYLTTDTALDFLDDDVRARVHVSQAPLVEGAVAAAVAAQTGGDVDAVLAAAASAAGSEADASRASSPSGAGPGGAAPGSRAGARGGGGAGATGGLVNASGRAARP
ncbi:dihydroxyacetone kinase phosphoryl donor subunit DhaM, partial [Curtobacterium sp. CT11-45]|uniref:dihydroxyacetone kinase phosphoryl donor subunit DhaM n=1 Tax=Curtobacterium sp. CT11-45 TaxID=3243037 RepID=UPI0039B1133A